MTTSVRATFTASRVQQGTDLLICRETGTRYSVRLNERGRFEVRAAGRQIAERPTKASALHCIESDARWQIREERREEYQRNTASERAYWHNHKSGAVSA
jgi:hypothetical protein